MTTLSVSEIFGPTLQGEGPNVGQRCGFIRLGRCNLDCVWCDTPFTWDWLGKNGVVYDPKKELTELEPYEIAEQVAAMNVQRVVITGGEPLIQQRGLVELIVQLKTRAGIKAYEIETNGTQKIRESFSNDAQFNVSIKLAHSGVEKDKRLNKAAVESLRGRNSYFKFVAKDKSDLLEVDEIIEWGDLPNDRIWIMPEGISPEAIKTKLPTLAEAVIERGWNLSDRLHVRVWGNDRGH